VNQLFTDFKKAYDSVKTEVLYNILLEFGIPKKLFRLIKMCLNEIHGKVRVGKLLSDTLKRVFCGKPEGKRPVETLRRRWKDNSKLDLRQIEFDGTNWTRLVQDRVQWWTFVSTVMNLRVP
jgi:hypothetical protein